jgi:hypothetical protein
MTSKIVDPLAALEAEPVEVKAEPETKVEPVEVKAAPEPVEVKAEPEAKVEAEPETFIDLHVVAVGGFSAFGRLWSQGQYLKIPTSGPDYEKTLDKEQKSWLRFVGDEAAQAEYYGRILFKAGPWPHEIADDTFKARELKRAGRPH